MEFQNRDWIIDAGAAEGFFTIFVSKKINLNTKIYAVEPLEIMHTALMNTFLKNEIKTVKLLKCGLSNYAGEAFFEINEKNVSDSKIIENSNKSKNIEKKVFRFKKTQSK
jgi:FkbM family methyltransferase